MSRLSCVTIALAFLTPLIAEAHICDYYQEHLPRFYELFCKNSGSRSARAASAGSGSASVADSFNINPSSLPTDPSPYGIEVIRNHLSPEARETGYTFAVIKGFHKIGAGISTASNNTFYGNDIVQRRYGTPEYDSLKPAEAPKSDIPNLNFGTSFMVARAREKKGASLALGVSGRFNQITRSLGWGAGFLMTSRYLNFGGGWVKEKISNSLPPIDFYSFVVGFKAAIFEVEYSVLDHAGGYPMSSIHIVTVTTMLGPVLITGAARSIEYAIYGRKIQTHYAVQAHVTKKLTLGFLMNHIMESYSLGAQIFL